MRGLGFQLFPLAWVKVILNIILRENVYGRKSSTILMNFFFIAGWQTAIFYDFHFILLDSISDYPVDSQCLGKKLQQFARFVLQPQSKIQIKLRSHLSDILTSCCKMDLPFPESTMSCPKHSAEWAYITFKYSASNRLFSNDYNSNEKRNIVSIQKRTKEKTYDANAFNNPR